MKPIGRREAVRRSLAAALALPWFLSSPRIRPRAGTRARLPAALTADLPPRTVGLRSLGGAFRFDPPGLLVSAGDVVTWLNIGDFHTVTAFHPANQHLLREPIRRRTPVAAQPFHSGMLGLDAGSVFEHRFDVEGVHDYFCQPHYGFGMVGRVVVGPGDVSEDPYGDGSDLPEPARRELPAVGSITGPAGRAREWASRVNGLLLLRVRDADPVPAVDAILRGVRADRALADAFGSESVEGFVGRLDVLAAAVREGAGYERLVGHADDAKAALHVDPEAAD